MPAETEAPEQMGELTITVGQLDGEPFVLPIEEILTGRGFITGKSGAGKSNTASVVLEQLLEAGYGFLVVDVDGEYYGLKESYEILHAGAGETCDIQVGPEHAEKLASLALDQHVPIILDVSEYVDERGPGEQSDEARELVRRTAESLFTKEHDLQQPFLLVVEEIHEFVPEGPALDAVGQQLVQIGKRGRKRGLGLVGLSQRPADVKKDFITQCDWLVWHRLTWENDTQVVKRVVGSDYEDPVQTLGDGEAFVQLDWADVEVLRVQFDRKQTFDAGETPGLDDVERPELKGIDEDLVEELADISDREQQRQDEIARLERVIEEKEERIDELEQELKQAQDVSNAAQQLASALQGDDEGVPEDFEDQLAEKNEEIHRLEPVIDDQDARIEELEAEVERASVNRERVQEAERIEERFDEVADHVEGLAGVLDVDVGLARPAPAESPVVDEDLRERVEQLEAENERLRAQVDVEIDEGLDAYGDFLQLDVVKREIEAAKDSDRTSDRYVKGVLAAIINENGPVAYDTIAERLGLSGTQHVSKAATELETRKIVTKENAGDGMRVDLNVDGINEIRQAAAEREKTEQLMESL